MGRGVDSEENGKHMGGSRYAHGWCVCSKTSIYTLLRSIERGTITLENSLELSCKVKSNVLRDQAIPLLGTSGEMYESDKENLKSSQLSKH